MSFDKIDEKSLRQAGKAVHAAFYGTHNAVYRETDGADLVAAGAVMALEPYSRHLDPSSNLKSRGAVVANSPLFRTALARFIDNSAKNEDKDPLLGEGIKGVVSEVLQRKSVSDINAALAGEEVGYLNEGQKNILDMAESAPLFAKDLKLIENGEFEKLSPAMSADVVEALNAPIEGVIGEEVSLISRAVEGIFDREEKIDAHLSSREEGWGNFSSISDRAFSRVEMFHREGATTGDVAFDGAMKLLASEGLFTEEDIDYQNPMMIAQARLYQDVASSVSMASSDLASMAISDVNIMNAARADLSDNPDSSIIGEGKYHLLEEGKRADIQRDILYGMRTPASQKIRFETNMLVYSGIAAMDKAHFNQKAEQRETEKPAQNVQSQSAMFHALQGHSR